MSSGLLDAVKTPTHRDRASNSTWWNENQHQPHVTASTNTHQQCFNVRTGSFFFFFPPNVWHLNAIVPTQLLSIQSRAVDSMECQFHSSWEERGRFREELIVLCFHCDGFDEHGITGVFVRFQVWLKIKKSDQRQCCMSRGFSGTEG